MKNILKIRTIEDERIIFTDGSILEAQHYQDCCESHYLDFSLLDRYNISPITGKPLNIYEQEFDFSEEIPFEPVNGLGIMLIDTKGNKFLVNGYGFNNGYYSTNLDLVLHKEGEIIYEYDVSKCQDIDWV